MTMTAHNDHHRQAIETTLRAQVNGMADEILQLKRRIVELQQELQQQRAADAGSTHQSTSVKPKAFPGGALKRHAQRIGLFSIDI